MAFTLIQQAAAASATATTNTRSLTGVTAGSTLVVMIGNRSGNIAPTGISDTVNGAWTLSNGIGAGDAGAGVQSGIYFFPNSGSGSPTITVTYGSSYTNIMAAQEWGVASSAVVTDGTPNSAVNSATTSMSNGSITTTGAGLILTAACEASTLTETPNASFTALNDSGLRLYMQYWITSSGQTTDGVFTTSVSGTSVGVILGLKEPSASGAFNPISSRGAGAAQPLAV